MSNYCLKNPNEATWTRADKVGDPVVSEFNGRQVVLADNTLDEFGKFLLTLTLDFEYDHAVGVLK